MSDLSHPQIVPSILLLSVLSLFLPSSFPPFPHPFHSVEDPYAYCHFGFGDYALIPRSLYPEPSEKVCPLLCPFFLFVSYQFLFPPQPPNNNNNNNNNKKKKNRKGASKAEPQKPNEEVTDDLLCAWVVMTETKVKIQWQDGSIQEGFSTHTLPPSLPPPPSLT